MLTSLSPGAGPLDVNTLRAVEQISVVLNDVEQKIQMLRMSLHSQSPTWPSLNPSFLGSPLGVTPTTTSTSIATLISHPLVQQQLLSNPVVQQHLLAISASLQGPTSFPSTPQSTVNTPFFGTPGVNAPFGFSPFQAPMAPFRF